MTLVNWLDLAVELHRCQQQGFGLPTRIYHHPPCARWLFWVGDSAGAVTDVSILQGPNLELVYRRRGFVVSRNQWVKQLRTLTEDPVWKLESMYDGTRIEDAIYDQIFGFLEPPKCL